MTLITKVRNEKVAPFFLIDYYISLQSIYQTQKKRAIKGIEPTTLENKVLSEASAPLILIYSFTCFHGINIIKA